MPKTEQTKGLFERATVVPPGADGFESQSRQVRLLPAHGAKPGTERRAEMKELTVKELREALEGVPDDLPVMLSSDTGVDQGVGYIIIEKARRVKYNDVDYFEIYANDHVDDPDEMDCEGMSDEDVQSFNDLIGEANRLLEEYEED